MPTSGHGDKVKTTSTTRQRSADPEMSCSIIENQTHDLKCRTVRRRLRESSHEPPVRPIAARLHLPLFPHAIPDEARTSANNYQPLKLPEAPRDGPQEGVA